MKTRLTLSDIRRRRYLTVRALAQLAGVSPQTIVNIEQGHKPPMPATMLKIASALHVEPGDVREFAHAAGIDVDAETD